MNKTISYGAVTLLLAFATLPAGAATLRVGPGQTYATPSMAASAARDGDTIEIAAGTYSGDVAVWRANGLTLRGVGGQVVLEAAGRAAQNKAIWVIQGDNTKVENIAFTGASVPDRNGAGIRQEGGNLTVRHCRFFNNEDGILASVNAHSDILVEGSVFDHNGQGDGYSHNLYIGNVHRFTLRGCAVRNAHIGHDVKSRAEINEIIANDLGDDAASDTSFVVDFPNGGQCLLVGNVIERGGRASSHIVVNFGEEGATNAVQTLDAVSNTFISRQPDAVFLRVVGGGKLTAVNNLCYGAGALPGNVTAQESDFRNFAKGDYQLSASSKARGRGKVTEIMPRLEFAAPVGVRPRPRRVPLDAGAYARDTEATARSTAP